MAKYSSFEAQAVEILEQIFEQVPDQSDLLSLSFASTVFAKVIIPRYLSDCCVDVQNTPLLQKILLSPLRHRISSMEIVSKADTAGIRLYEEKPVLSLPGTNVVDDADFDATLLALLREMTGLRKFHWNVTGIPPSPDIFVALQSRASPVECVQIHSLRSKGHNDVPDRWFLRDSPLWKLSNLTSFSYAVSSLTSMYNSVLYIPQLLQMIRGCAMLEELELLLAHDDRSSDLRGLFQGRWPQLRSLLIGGPEKSYSVTVPASSKADVQAFFSAHSALEHLYLGINLDMKLSYPWNDIESPGQSFAIASLSSLTLLHVPHNVFTMIASSAYMPDLQHLRRVEIEESYVPRFRELTQNAPNITSLWVGVHHNRTRAVLRAFFGCFPRLEKVYFTDSIYYFGNGVAFTGFPRAQDPLAEACDVLSILPRLTHLSHFVILYADEEFDALVDPVVHRLATVLPRLTFLEVIVVDFNRQPTVTQDVLVRGSNWLTIRRDETGVCTGWSVVAETQQLELHHTRWGSLNWLLGENKRIV
ncbi:hypothetical protein DFH06DRAFT_763816 [Mycena polygramma]|nr:hypothetical protein DFH06DRAFT_763816 [Mycena polygramma]